MGVSTQRPGGASNATICPVQLTDGALQVVVEGVICEPQQHATNCNNDNDTSERGCVNQNPLVRHMDLSGDMELVRNPFRNLLLIKYG
ncbi:unnamed protein product [Phytophthora fragariaefolia]|uniref:Unnamed protein product n=1 Tax=Phytophthora fragariaefolia TaxID=1490495 RepID=A0A9W6XXA8_9STRA|nr:unnamed protein product [Phytophthora fragariaefolia]